MTNIPAAKKHYLPQKDFFDELVQSRTKGEISNKLGEMFLLLARKYSNHRNFVRYYHIKDDLIAIGAAACVKGFTKFRPYKDPTNVWDEQSPITYDHNTCSNALAFFTTIIHNDLIAFLKKEYNQSNIMNEKRLESGLDASFGYVEMISEAEAKERAERMAEDSYEDAAPEMDDFKDSDNDLIAEYEDPDNTSNEDVIRF